MYKDYCADFQQDNSKLQGQLREVLDGAKNSRSGTVSTEPRVSESKDHGQYDNFGDDGCDIRNWSNSLGIGPRR